LGGHEADPVTALRVYEELAWSEPSVGWIAWNNQYPSLLMRHLSSATCAELFSDAQHLVTASSRQSGSAVPVHGGYRVTGRWALVSGCELSDWIGLNCSVVDAAHPEVPSAVTATRRAETRMAYVPRGSFTILDTWQVGGLRGTGSHDVVVEDVFVPAERTFTNRDPIQLDGPLYQMPFSATMAAGCSAICLGIAQAAIDTLQELAGTKVSVSS